VNVLRADEINFSEYEWETDCRAKVRTVSDYQDETLAELNPVQGKGSPTMFSSKLKHCLQFRPGEVTAWAGYSGHRKSMFTGQIALELGLQGVPTLIKSFEMSPAKTLARMARQHTAQQYPTPEAFTRFNDKTSGKVWLFDHLGRIDPKRALTVCRYFANELGGKQVFIDSFMMVCGSEERMDEQKQFATDLNRLAQETGLHVHIIAHCRKPASGDETNPPGKHDLRGTAAITDQCANVVTVWANKAKKARLAESEFDPIANEPDAAITVCKQRNSDFEGRLKFWFDDDSMRFTDERGAGVQAW
jgi:twinkle protein